MRVCGDPGLDVDVLRRRGARLGSFERRAADEDCAAVQPRRHPARDPDASPRRPDPDASNPPPEAKTTFLGEEPRCPLGDLGVSVVAWEAVDPPTHFPIGAHVGGPPRRGADPRAGPRFATAPSWEIRSAILDSPCAGDFPPMMIRCPRGSVDERSGQHRRFAPRLWKTHGKQTAINCTRKASFERELKVGTVPARAPVATGRPVSFPRRTSRSDTGRPKGKPVLNGNLHVL